MAKTCVACDKGSGFLGGLKYFTIKDKDYCSDCVEKLISSIQVTTTNHFDGYCVKKYINIESVEIVVGTGIFSEVGGGISDFFGMRSTAFEQKLATAKKTAFQKLKFNALLMDGNAIIGVDIDYTEFSGNRIGLVVNGTVVEIEPVAS
jgi:uncharacterized protein YbjQ (UPF0145 family)